MDKFDGNFRQLSICDVSAIRQNVLAFTAADWEAESWRQEKFEAHRDTQTIELVYTKDFRYEPPAKRDKYAELNCDDLLAPMVEAISDYYTGDGFVARALFVRLKAHGAIPIHVDAGYPLMNARRIHTAITSNDQVVFTVGGEPRVMEEGELWEINNARPHQVVNQGDQSRVHLIIDWVPT